MTTEHAKPADLAQHVLDKLGHSKLPFPVPPLSVLEGLFECLFYASMKTEESDLIKVALTLIRSGESRPESPETNCF